MALTYNELLEKLRETDEVSLLELLEITSDDLVDKFADEIEEKADDLFAKFDDGDESE